MPGPNNPTSGRNEVMCLRSDCRYNDNSVMKCNAGQILVGDGLECRTYEKGSAPMGTGGPGVPPPQMAAPGSAAPAPQRALAPDLLALLAGMGGGGGSR